MRNSELNRVSTTVIRNKDIIAALDNETRDALKKAEFFTPHEVISVHGGRSEAGVELKPILKDEGPVPLCYFETRTQATTQEGKLAIKALDAAIHQNKNRVFLGAGDFVSIANNHSLHAREVIHIGDREGHQKRWLCKTFNVADLSAHQHLMLHDNLHVANE